MYWMGNGVKKDPGKAFDWYLKSAEKMYQPAMEEVALCYYRGDEGIPINYHKAEKWYRRLIDIGSIEAIYDWGNLFLYGSYEPLSDDEIIEEEYESDEFKAFCLFLFAAKCGSTDAMEEIAHMYDSDDIENEHYEESIKSYLDKNWKHLNNPISIKKIDDFLTYEVENKGKIAWEPLDQNKKMGYQIKWLKMAIDSGSSSAALKLGDICKNSYFYDQDIDKIDILIEARTWYDKALELSQDDFDKKEAEEKIKENCFDLAHTYKYDYNNNSEAAKQYLQLIKYGYNHFSYDLADCYYCDCNYEEAAKWYRKAVEQGKVEAQSKLGLMYEDGLGVPKNYAKAVEWYIKAAEQGDIFAQYRLGEIYYSGKGVSQDYAKTAKWSRKAAEQGYEKAQYRLGDIYFYGKGVSQDYAKAAEWYQKAAEQGNAISQYELGRMYYSGIGISQDYKKAAAWFQKAAEQGDAYAQYGLGEIYYYGLEVSQDYTKAYEWYRKAAEQRFALAQYNLGVLYYTGNGVSQDYAKAAEWYRKAAEQGNADAQTYLGYMYDTGNGISQNYVKAAEWYSKAAEQGNATAQYNLGIMYYNGYGVSQNYTKAAEWYRKAAEQGHANAQKKLEDIYKKGLVVPKSR